MELILLLPPAAIVALLLVGGWGYTAGREAEACCAACRYPVTGLRDHVCPECGADLRGHGTRPASARRIVRPSRFVAATCRTVLLAIPTTIVLGSLATEYPRIVSTADVTASSADGLFTSLTISGRGAARPSHPRHAYQVGVARTHTRATLVGPRRAVTLQVTDAAARAVYDIPAGRARTLDRLTRDDILQWMSAAGVDTADPRAQGAAVDISTLIINVVAGSTSIHGRLDSLANPQMTSGRDQTLRPEIVAIVLLPALILWLVLLAGLRRWPARPRPA